MNHFKRFISILLHGDILIPLALLIIYVIFIIIARGTIPTSEELVDTFAALYAAHGFEIILVAAFLESLILVNFFVPGQLAMALGIIFARSGHTDLTVVLLSAATGAVAGYCIDFLLGAYGFSDVVKKLGYGGFLHQAKDKLRRFGKRGLVIGFVNTNIASFLAFAAGATGYNFAKFISLAIVSTLFWSAMWGMIIYAFGDIVLTFIKEYSFLLVLLVLGGLIISRIWKAEESKAK